MLAHSLGGLRSVVGKKRPFPDAPPPHMPHYGKCAICLQELATSKAIFQAPGCAHRFHLTCITDLVSLSPSKQDTIRCPVCRRIWDPEELPVASPQKSTLEKDALHSAGVDEDIHSLELVQRTNAFTHLDRQRMAQSLQQHMLLGAGANLQAQARASDLPGAHPNAVSIQGLSVQHLQSNFVEE